MGALQRAEFVWLADEEIQNREFELDCMVRNLEFMVEN